MLGVKQMETNMTRMELRQELADRIERDFNGRELRANGTPRPTLERSDCEHLANLIFSEIGQSGLGIFDVEDV